MRKLSKLLSTWLLAVLLLPALAAAAPASAPAGTPSAASRPAVSLTPDQARQALDVLNDPQRRAQVTDTLHAIAAAGALAAPPAAASAPATASAAAAASAPLAFKSNGLAAQLARQGAHWLGQGGASVKRSLSVLLDTASVRDWWRGEVMNPQERARLASILFAILATILPALALEWLARRLLRRAREAIAARRSHRESGYATARADTTAQPAETAPPGSAAAASAQPATPAATAGTSAEAATQAGSAAGSSPQPATQTDSAKAATQADMTKPGPATAQPQTGLPGPATANAADTSTEDADDEAAARAAGFAPAQAASPASAAASTASKSTASTAAASTATISTPPAAASPSPAANPTSSAATASQQNAKAARAKNNAAQHWTLLQRLPGAALHLLLRLLPLAVFVAAASVLMSIFADDGTPQDRALSTLIDLYVLCRAIAIAGGFFLQPDAPALRLLRMPDSWASFVQRWIVWIVCAIGGGAALVETALALGLSDSAHTALVKLVALAGHVLLSIMILQCRKPIAALVRDSAQNNRPITWLGEGFVDLWAGIAVFIVMALWFVWALDVQNGYETLLHLGGISVGVLIAARVVSIVVFGALGRLFHRDEDADRSLAHQHAYRYYPLLRRVVYAIIAAITVLVLLQVWHVDVWQFFQRGTVGHRLASALATIFVAALFALFVWEVANVSVEQRLERWTASGDLTRAARLRTLLPMLRSALFVVIALVVVMTGLSELGVNTAPLLASASIFGVALGFGSQKLVQDFITGIFLLMENAMQVGDWVTLAGVSGTVEYLSIRTVRLRGGDGSLYTVPFSSVSTVNNTNRGLGNAAVKVSIAYGQDLDLAIDTLKEIGAALRTDDKFKDGILSDFAFWGVDSVDGSALTLTGQVQCRDSGRWGVQREFNRRIFEQFSARGIQIANPQRTVVVPPDGWQPGAALNGRGVRSGQADGADDLNNRDDVDDAAGDGDANRPDDRSGSDGKRDAMPRKPAAH